MKATGSLIDISFNLHDGILQTSFSVFEYTISDGNLSSHAKSIGGHTNPLVEFFEGFFSPTCITYLGKEQLQKQW